MRRLRVAAVTFIVVLGAGGAADSRGADGRAEPGTAAAIQEVLSAQEAQGQTISAVELAQLPALYAAYAARDFQPIWTGSAEARERARIAQDVLRGAGDHGLEPRDYESAISSLGADGQLTAESDVELTRDVLRYVRDVRVGRLPPGAIYGDVGLPDQTFDAAAALSAALRDGAIADFLAGLPPPHAEYRHLVAALARYRAVQARGGWPSIPSSGEVKTDGSDPRLDLVMKRLRAEESDAGVPADPVAAVKHYQQRNGLASDGRIGALTLEMLNVSAAERVAQIAANMERWRWLPRGFEHRYIAVNVPDQSLRFIENGMDLLTSRVIVGRPQTPTPIFRATVLAVTANPPWNVPHSIATKEILPRLRRNPDYLLTQDMILLNGPAGDPAGVRVDWRGMRAEQFPYLIQQAPGDKNALGRLKLELPNRFSVFLHDTPGKALFEREQRTLSHGCIRVQEIRPLAALALGGERETAMARLDAAIGAGATRQIELRDPLPVYVLYWTAMAEEDGSVGFRRDIYGRDRRLQAALAGNAPSARAAMDMSGCPLPG